MTDPRIAVSKRVARFADVRKFWAVLLVLSLAGVLCDCSLCAPRIAADEHSCCPDESPAPLAAAWLSATACCLPAPESQRLATSTQTLESPDILISRPSPKDPVTSRPVVTRARILLPHVSRTILRV